MKKLVKYFWKDKVFMIAFTLAILSMFFITPSWDYLDYVNEKVLVVMFTMMIAVAGMYEANFFSFIAINMVKKFFTIRYIGLVIVFATFLLGMFVTNDATLLTLVPFTLYVTKQTGQERHALIIVILQAIAANMGSALTPMGDPQNIYLYAFYEIDFMEFIKTMLPITITGFVLVMSTTWLLVPNEFCQPIVVSPKVDGKRLILYGLIFTNALLCVLRVIPETWAIGITLVLTLPLCAHLLKKVDYTLLLTFLSFFIFTGNLGKIPEINNFVSGLLSSETSVYFTGLITSQFISNVPAAVLLSTFTDRSLWQPLLQGVNVGAMGTIIGSLASLITIKIVTKEFPDQWKPYLKTYSLICIIFIVIITAVVFIT